jgi:hypothetical protein
VRFEHIARLIFKQVHGLVSFYVEVVSVQPDNTKGADRAAELRRPAAGPETSHAAQCSFGNSSPFEGPARSRLPVL